MLRSFSRAPPPPPPPPPPPLCDQDRPPPAPPQPFRRGSAPRSPPPFSIFCFFFFFCIEAPPRSLTSSALSNHSSAAWSAGSAKTRKRPPKSMSHTLVPSLSGQLFVIHPENGVKRVAIVFLFCFSHLRRRYAQAAACRAGAEILLPQGGRQ